MKETVVVCVVWRQGSEEGHSEHEGARCTAGIHPLPAIDVQYSFTSHPGLGFRSQNFPRSNFTNTATQNTSLYLLISPCRGYERVRNFNSSNCICY